MAKDKIGNLLKFTEYDHLQMKQKPSKYTEVGGFAVLEGVSVKELIKLAAKKSGKSKKELKNLSPKKLKKIIGENKIKTGKPKEKEETKPVVQAQEEEKTNERFFPKTAGKRKIKGWATSSDSQEKRDKYIKKKKSEEKEPKNESLVNLFYGE
jgi:hypothetical protein